MVEIILLVVCLLLLVEIYLLCKRMVLIVKLRKKAKDSNITITWLRNPVISVFLHDGKSDFCFKSMRESVFVTIITTPFSRLRYHFNLNDNMLEIILERKSVYIINPRVPNPTASMDRVYSFRKYKMSLIDRKTRYIILNPAPKSTSKAENGTLSSIYNGDSLCSGTKVCGLKYFLDTVLVNETS